MLSESRMPAVEFRTHRLNDNHGGPLNVWVHGRMEYFATTHDGNGTIRDTVISAYLTANGEA